MSTEKEKIKYPGFLNKLWYDPIWSKAIYAGILFVAGLLYSFFATFLKDVSWYEAFVETINYSLKLYVIFIILTAGLLVYGIIYRIRQKRKRHVGNFDVEQKIGDFTFRELYNALLTHRVELPISLKSGFEDGKLDLLTLFVLYQRQLNKGIEWDMGGDQGVFLYHVLGPTLMSYGLTELAANKNKADSLGLDLIMTSKVGYSFYALLERWRVYNDQIMKDDITKTGDTGTESEINYPQPKQKANAGRAV